MSTVKNQLPKVLGPTRRNKLLVAFISLHMLFAIFLGRLFAFAPDESSYLYTFNNLYGSHDPNPQSTSGWITAPKIFLWILYLPAKVLNLLGVPDYLAARILSISVAALCLLLLLNLNKRSGNSNSRFGGVVFFAFFIPSIFLWTSVGLREVFILLEVLLVIVGIEYLFRGKNKHAIVYISLGSYGLLSTKNYLWICLVLSTLVLVAILALLHVSRRKLITLSVALILVPCIVFASTTSIYALKFLVTSVFHSNLAAEGSRTGDSTLQLAIPDQSGSNSGSNSGRNSGGSPGSHESDKSGGKGKTVVTFHGDTTVILLHSYFVDHPNVFITRLLHALRITDAIQRIWDSKVKSGLITQKATSVSDNSSLSGHLFKPGKLHNPLSMIRPVFLFMFGPIPFIHDGGIALSTVALESPLWWILYSLVIFRLIRYRKNEYFRDPVFLIAAVYFFSLVAVSSLVEVNLGTAFRHRSILFIPLLVMFIRARGKNPVAAD